MPRAARTFLSCSCTTPRVLPWLSSAGSDPLCLMSDAASEERVGEAGAVDRESLLFITVYPTAHIAQPHTAHCATDYAAAQSPRKVEPTSVGTCTVVLRLVLSEKPALFIDPHT